LIEGDRPALSRFRPRDLREIPDTVGTPLYGLEKPARLTRLTGM